MSKVAEIMSFLEEIAPLELKVESDNPGLLVGLEDREVSRILVALDITDDVIKEAGAMGAELIVSHHPLFFSLNKITSSDRTGLKIINLISGGISAICMHTNLDAAWGGVNDALARAAGLQNVKLLREERRDDSGKACGVGRVGELPDEMDFKSYLPYLKERINSGGLRYHDAGRPVKRVAVTGGTGGDYMQDAIAEGCDTFITADIKYSLFLEAKERGINLIDGDHFCTENTVCPVLAEHLMNKYPDVKVDISKVHTQTVQFL